MDGRHFAEEYVRRKGLAERGVVERQPAASLAGSEAKASAGSAGGWSEVAKKSGGSSTPGAAGAASPAAGADPIQAAGFKVVPSRKKGKK